MIINAPIDKIWAAFAKFYDLDKYEPALSK